MPDSPIMQEFRSVIVVFTKLFSKYIHDNPEDDYDKFERLFVNLLQEYPNIRDIHFAFCVEQVVGSKDAASIFINMWKFEHVISSSDVDGVTVYNYGRN